MANENIRKFEPVEIREEQPDPALARAANAAAVEALKLGLKALSQRAVAGLRAAFTLLSAAAIFWVWTATPDPKPSQIVSMTIFAITMLVANVIVRRV
jgi:hypothetical protein